MTTIKQVALIIVLTLCPAFCSTARAQMPALDMAIDSDQVRFAATEQEMRVEVYAPSGEMVFDSGGKAGPSSNTAKLLASEACVEAVDALVKVYGGNAFDNDYDVLSLLPVSRLMCNAPINNDMVLNYIAEHVLGLPRSY